MWSSGYDARFAREARVQSPARVLFHVHCVRNGSPPGPDGRTQFANKHTNLPPRVTPFLFDPPVGAHAVAQGFGHVAAVYTGDQRTVVSTHLPSWFSDMVDKIPGESPIFIYERCDAILTACLVLAWSRGKQRTCVLRVDNQVAVAALVKGSPSSTLGTLLASLFWNIAARWSALWWIEYVRAKSNDADAPSRRCTYRCGIARTYHSGDIPHAFSEALSSWGHSTVNPRRSTRKR